MLFSGSNFCWIWSICWSIFLLRHTEIIFILGLFKCGIPLRGVGQVPARTPPLAWFVAIITVVCFAGVCCLFCCSSHLVHNKSVCQCVNRPIPELTLLLAPQTCKFGKQLKKKLSVDLVQCQQAHNF